ncbi:MAG: hypothetical protein WC748_04175, partial [Legionellales bacterium]
MLQVIRRAKWPNELKKLLDSLDKKEKIHIIDLQKKGIDDEGLKTLIIALEENSTVHDINLRNNQIGDEGAKALATLLKTNPTLENIDLRGNNIGNIGLVSLTSALEENNTIQQLYLNENHTEIANIWNLDNREPDKITKYLTRNNNYRQFQLDLEEFKNDANTHLMWLTFNTDTMLREKQLIACSQVLKKRKNITQITGGNRNIGDDEIKIIASIISGCPIESIYFDNTRISNEGVKILAAALENKTTVETLILTGNKFDNDGEVKLLDMLKKNKTITRLDLDDLYLNLDISQYYENHNHGAKAYIWEQIKFNMFLKYNLNDLLSSLSKETSSEFNSSSWLKFREMYLYSQNIQRDIVNFTAKAWKNNTTIIELNLASCQFSDKDVDWLIIMLAENTTVQTINLKNNSISDTGAKALASLVKRNTNIKEIILEGNNYIKPETQLLIKQQLRKNCAATWFNDFLASLGDKSTKELTTWPLLDENASIYTNQLTLLENAFKKSTINKVTFNNSSLSNQENKLLAEDAILLLKILQHNTTVQEIELTGIEMGDEGASALACLIDKNAKIKKISIKNNRIGKNGAMTIASALEKNASIEEINLAENSISTEGVKALALMLSKNTHLQKITIDYKELGNENIKTLALALEKNYTIRCFEFDRHNNNTPPFNSNLKIIEKYLKRNCELYTFEILLNNLNQNTISELNTWPTLSEDLNVRADQLKELKQSVHKNTSLKTIDLKDSTLNTQDIIELTASLENNNSIQILCLKNCSLNDSRIDRNILDDNVINENHIKAIASLLLKNTSIREVHLPNTVINNQTLKLIATALRKNVKIQKFTCKNELIFQNVYGNDAAVVLLIQKYLKRNNDLLAFRHFINLLQAQRITEFKSWHTLSEHPETRAQQLTELAKVLQLNASILEVDLEIKLGDETTSKVLAEGAKYLADILHENSVVRKINLDSNEIGDEGTFAIANSLANNSSLQTLHLWNNGITDSGVIEIAKALKNNTILQEINLAGNQITDEGIGSLADALELNSNLKTIHLYKNKITDEGAKLLLKSLETNTSIQNIYLHGNKISDINIALIEKRLKHNREAAPLNLSKKSPDTNRNNANINYKPQEQKIDNTLQPTKGVPNQFATKPASNAKLNITDVYSLITEPSLAKHSAFLMTLPDESLKNLVVFAQQDMDLSAILSIIATLKSGLDDLSHSLKYGSKQEELNIIAQDQMAEIKNNKILSNNYKILKGVLSRTLFIARLMYAKLPEHTDGTPTSLNQIIEVAGCVYPSIKPFLEFTVVLLRDNDIKNLASWGEMNNMVDFCLLLSRQITIARSKSEFVKYTTQEKSLLKNFGNDCNALFQIILDNDESLSSEKAFAIIDFHAALDYMKKNRRPENKTLEEYVDSFQRPIPPTDLSASSKPQTDPKISLSSKATIATGFHTAQISNQYNNYISTLSQENIGALQILLKHGANLDNMLPILEQLKLTQENLTQRLESVETQTGLDEQTLREIEHIQKNEKLNLYYQTLKMLLGQTFLAAYAISSGEVDASKGVGATIASGIGKIISSTCPPAAPFVELATFAFEKTDSINNFHAMKSLASWASIEEMALFSAAVSRLLTLAQEFHLIYDLKNQEKKILQQIKNKCVLLMANIYSAKPLTIEENRALLDASELLTFMKEHARPS